MNAIYDEMSLSGKVVIKKEPIMAGEELHRQPAQNKNRTRHQRATEAEERITLYSKKSRDVDKKL